MNARLRQGDPTRLFETDEVRQALSECTDGDEFERHRCAEARKVAARTMPGRPALMELAPQLGTYDFERRAFPIDLPGAGRIVLRGPSYDLQSGGMVQGLAYFRTKTSRIWARVDDLDDAEAIRNADAPSLVLFLRHGRVERGNKPESRLVRMVRRRYRQKPEKEWRLPSRIVGLQILSRVDGRVLYSKPRAIAASAERALECGQVSADRRRETALKLAALLRGAASERAESGQDGI